MQVSDDRAAPLDALLTGRPGDGAESNATSTNPSVSIAQQETANVLDTTPPKPKSSTSKSPSTSRRKDYQGKPLQARLRSHQDASYHPHSPNPPNNPSAPPTKKAISSTTSPSPRNSSPTTVPKATFSLLPSPNSRGTPPPSNPCSSPYQ